MSNEDDAQRLSLLLSQSADSLIPPDGHAAVAFSGGLDSSVVAFLLKSRCRVMLYTAGAKGSRDLETCTGAAAALGLPVKTIVIATQDLPQAMKTVSGTIGTTDPVRIGYTLPLYFVARECEEKTIFTGQGADELFAGYGRYERMAPRELQSATASDLKTLIKTGIPGEKAIALAAGKDVCHIFLGGGIVEFAAALGPELKARDGTRKIVLREAAAAMGLPPSIYSAPKKAAQYSSGVMKMMERLAKERGCALSGLALRL